MRFQVAASFLAILVTNLNNVCHAEDPSKQRNERGLNIDHLALTEPSLIDPAGAASLSLPHNTEKVIDDNDPIESTNAGDVNVESTRNLQRHRELSRDIQDTGLTKNDMDSNYVGVEQAERSWEQNLRSLAGKGYGGMSGKRGGMSGMGGGMYSKGGGMYGNRGGMGGSKGGGMYGKGGSKGGGMYGKGGGMYGKGISKGGGMYSKGGGKGDGMYSKGYGTKAKGSGGKGGSKGKSGKGPGGKGGSNGNGGNGSGGNGKGGDYHFGKGDNNNGKGFDFWDGKGKGGRPNRRPTPPPIISPIAPFAPPSPIEVPTSPIAEPTPVAQPTPTPVAQPTPTPVAGPTPIVTPAPTLEAPVSPTALSEAVEILGTTNETFIWGGT